MTMFGYFAIADALVHGVRWKNGRFSFSMQWVVS